MNQNIVAIHLQPARKFEWLNNILQHVAVSFNWFTIFFHRSWSYFEQLLCNQLIIHTTWNHNASDRSTCLRPNVHKSSEASMRAVCCESLSPVP